MVLYINVHHVYLIGNLIPIVPPPAPHIGGILLTIVQRLRKKNLVQDVQGARPGGHGCSLWLQHQPSKGASNFEFDVLWSNMISQIHTNTIEFQSFSFFFSHGMATLHFSRPTPIPSAPRSSKASKPSSSPPRRFWRSVSSRSPMAGFQTQPFHGDFFFGIWYDGIYVYIYIYVNIYMCIYVYICVKTYFEFVSKRASTHW